MKRIVSLGSDTAIYDEDSRLITYRGEKYRLPENASPSIGDSIEIRGKRGILLEYSPSFLGGTGLKGTQTIKPSDYAYMIARSGIREGSTVLEAGCGVGQLTAALLWTVGDEGKVVSMDLKRENIERTKRNISGFQGIAAWDPRLGDVRSSTFSEKFDAAFLDIPDPWNAARTISQCMKIGSIVVTYSPNYNQTEKSVTEMSSHSFEHLETCEIMKRDILVREGKTRPSSNMLSHTAFLSFFCRKSAFSFSAKPD